MNIIKSVAKNTFIEAIRDRVLLSLLLFVLLLILSSFFLGELSAEQHNKIMKDIGLSAISVIGIVITIFLGMGLVYKEIEKKTIYNIFSKPINRYEFIIGKYIGLAFTIFVVTVLMSFILFVFLYLSTLGNEEFVRFYYGGLYHLEFIKAVYFQYLEFLVIIGLVLLFSSFTSPILTVLFTFFSVLIGRISSDLRLLTEDVGNSAVGVVTEVIYRIIPNLEKFDVRAEVVYGGEISSSLFMLTTIYAIIYSSVLVIASIIVFQKKQFK
ncbi:MAG: ABC transporter permease subunit [Candidatus Dadabacteria bacterium]|nr:ABC transporter permease subunit [Candidatus Dadabacteria bacterium]